MRRLFTFSALIWWICTPDLLASIAPQEPPPETQTEAKDEAPPPPPTEADVDAMIQRLDQARRGLEFEAARTELSELTGRLKDEPLVRKIAAAAADFLEEAALVESFRTFLLEGWERERALNIPGLEAARLNHVDEGILVLEMDGSEFKVELGKLPVDAQVAWLDQMPLELDRRVHLARFALYRDVKPATVAILHDVLESDQQFKDAADKVLADLFGNMPHGGYSWYHGRFLPALEVQRRRFLEDVVTKTATALGELSPLTSTDARNLQAGQLDSVQAALSTSTDMALRELQALYEPLREMIASYRRSKSLRRRRMEHSATWEAEAKAARELIGRYDKKLQPEVDEYRDRLAVLAADYEKIRSQDELRFRRWPTAEAATAFDSIQKLEKSVDALVRYREAYHGRVLLPFANTTPEGSQRAILPGRKGSGLEESLYTLLLFKTGRTLQFIERVEELRRAKAELTPWENTVLADYHFDALDRFNLQAITTSDPREWECFVVTNAYRRTLRLPPFEIDERMVVAARDHSIEMQHLGYFGHTSPTEKLKTPSLRVKVAGYQGGAGENCYGGGNASGRAAFSGWYHSPGHHRGLISGGPHMGVGADASHSMWTMNFGGTDWTLRLLHQDLDPALAIAIQQDLDRLERPRLRAEAEARLLQHGVNTLRFGLRKFAADFAESKQRTELAHTARLLALIAVDVGVELELVADFAVRRILDLLADPSAKVRSTAASVLRRLSARRMGFRASAPVPARVAAVRRWQKWWDAERESFAPDPETREEDVAAFEETRPTTTGQPPDAPIKVFSPSERLALARRLGGGKHTEKAVKMSLDWLEKHQDPDGAWYGRRFQQTCREAKCAHPAREEYEIAMTGLALLCYINGGHTLHTGDYQNTVRRGVEFLQGRLQDMGKFTTTSGYYLYQHAIGTQALVEAYGTSADPFIKASAQLALDFLVFAQHPEAGGWRYTARQFPDTSATGWGILCYASALKAGLRVSGLRAAREWFDRVTEGSYYRVGYQNAGDAHSKDRRLTAVGMVSRQILGSPYNDPILNVGAAHCLEQLPQPEWMDIYLSYYATLALFQIGGERWEKWNKAMSSSLIARIKRDAGDCNEGSYDRTGPYGGHGGRIYATTLSTLMLEVYYRYDKFPEVRSLSVTGSIQQQLDPWLAKLGDTTNAVERGVAMRTIEDKFGTSAQRGVLKLLKESEDDAVRVDASFLLLRVATSGILTDLLELAADKNDTVVANVHLALARVAHPACIPELIKRLSDPRRAVRGHSARTLASLGDVKALDPLVARAAVEKDGWARGEMQKAMRALTHRSKIAVLLDDADLPNTEPRARAEVESGLVQLQRESLVEPLLALKTTKPKLYEDALEAIRLDGRHSLIPLLFTILEGGDAEAQGRALRLLRALTGRSHGFDPKKSVKDRKEALAAWQKWWRAARKSLFGERDNGGS